MEFDINDDLDKESKEEVREVMSTITQNNTHLGLTASVSQSEDQLRIEFENGTLDGKCIKNFVNIHTDFLDLNLRTVKQLSLLAQTDKI